MTDPNIEAACDDIAKGLKTHRGCSPDIAGALSAQLIAAAERPECDTYSATLLLHASQMIDGFIGDAQPAPLPPVLIEWARPVGSTFQEMRDNVWKCGLADKGDTILVWVNEGDFWHATMVCGAKEHTPAAFPSKDGKP